jgi:predicted nucleic acid-binding protein
MTIFGYHITRVDDYQTKVTSLQHLETSRVEFQIRANTGNHAVTTYVNLPEKEEKPAIKRLGSTALSDILLLLSIFTGRDVFTVDNASDGSSDRIIIADPRVYDWGGVLITSIPYKNQPIPDNEPYGYNIGFEEALNRVYLLVRSEDWQRKYKGGNFLILAQQAFRRQPLETAFTQCWTIWEYLFSVHNDRWLSDEQLRRLHSTEKIAFLLVEYALKGEIDKSEKGRIESLAEIRNKLIHSGYFPERSSVYNDAVLFIRLTEFIIAKTLGLYPSNVFNTMGRLDDFLKTQTRKQKR